MFSSISYPPILGIATGSQPTQRLLKPDNLVDIAGNARCARVRGTAIIAAAMKFTDHILTYDRRPGFQIPWFFLACALSAAALWWYVAQLPPAPITATKAPSAYMPLD
jgi:hypothetical protein